MTDIGHSKGQKMNVAYMNKVVHLSMVLGAVMLLMGLAFIELIADLSTSPPSRFAEVCASEGGQFVEDECIMPRVFVRAESDGPSSSVKVSSGGWSSGRAYAGANVESRSSSGEAGAYAYATVDRPRESHWGGSAIAESGASASAHAFGGN
jgi:hypothetical protein